MNRFKKYILHYDVDGQSQHLTYKLTDGIVTELWSGIIKDYFISKLTQFTSRDLEINAFDPDILSVQKNWKVILDNCNFLDSIDYPHKELFDIKSDSVPTEEALNYLHKRFHYIAEKFHGMPDPTKCDFTAIARKLSEINTAIHRIENRTMIANAAGGYVNITLRDSYKRSTYIDDDLRRYFYHEPNIQTRPGDLWLSYGTIGKTLWDCYRDNDVQLVREMGLRPKITITSEHAISFGARVPTNLQDNLLQVVKWLQDNKLERYVNPVEPQHYYMADPLLAQLETELKPEQLNHIFLNYPFTKFDIE